MCEGLRALPWSPAPKRLKTDSRGFKVSADGVICSFGERVETGALRRFASSLSVAYAHARVRASRNSRIFDFLGSATRALDRRKSRTSGPSFLWRERSRGRRRRPFMKLISEACMRVVFEPSMRVRFYRPVVSLVVGDLVSFEGLHGIVFLKGCRPPWCRRICRFWVPSMGSLLKPSTGCVFKVSRGAPWG